MPYLEQNAMYNAFGNNFRNGAGWGTVTNASIGILVCPSRDPTGMPPRSAIS